MTKRVIYAGIDEAGYGPLLGPLCVGMSVMEIGPARAGQRAEGARPDLWAMLAPAVVREVRDAGGASIAVNDSKRVKLPGTAKRHPLEHLERGVLAALSCRGGAVAADTDLHDSLEAACALPEWYSPDAVALPVACTPDQLRLITARLGAACDRAAVRFAALACRVCHETDFNAEVSRGALKSDISFDRVSSLLRSVWDSHALDGDLDEFGPRVVVDRQGGRVAYADRLAGAVPGSRVRTVMERHEVSVYDLEGSDGRRMRITFAIDADASHFPTALASMIAKFVRELAMLRFNRYWCGRITELKPTAGYGTDAKRWLGDVEKHLSKAERAALRRMA